jgi:hypothetical protein
VKKFALAADDPRNKLGIFGSSRYNSNWFGMVQFWKCHVASIARAALVSAFSK